VDDGLQLRKKVRGLRTQFEQETVHSCKKGFHRIGGKGGNGGGGFGRDQRCIRDTKGGILMGRPDFLEKAETEGTGPSHQDQSVIANQGDREGLEEVKGRGNKSGVELVP